MPTKAIIDKLLATSAVTDLVGTQVRPGKLDEADSGEKIVVERESVNPVNEAGGTTATKFATVLVGCFGDIYREAETLADVVEEALNGFTKTTGTPLISMTHVQDNGYEPGPIIPGADSLRERFVLNCLVQYSIP